MNGSTSSRKRDRNNAISTLTLLLGLGSIASSHAQTYASNDDQRKGNTTARTATRENKGSSVDQNAVRPFRASAPKEELVDLRRRIAATRWPDKETVADQSQGAQLAKLQELVRYWGTEYDWRKAEAKLNAFPQFMTKIDGVDIHFIHVRSRHPNAMPLIITHGWPGSVFEQIKLIGPLTDPTAFGGRAEDAFDVVIPSLPGFGFSARPTEAGWGLERIGRAWGVLMKRLGYTRYVAQGGDWGRASSRRWAGRRRRDCSASTPTCRRRSRTRSVRCSAADPRRRDSPRRNARPSRSRRVSRNGGLAYLVMMGARPQAVGYGLTDSPAGLAGWMLVHSGFDKWSYGKDPKQSPTQRRRAGQLHPVLADEHRGLVGADLLGESRPGPDQPAAQKTDEIAVPVAITVFPDEVFRAPEAGPGAPSAT